MATTTCPKCGNPLRPGAKFCGNCGLVISAASAAQPPAGSPAPVGGPVCPNCGKPVRPEAKFCANCGKVIGSGPLPPPPVQSTAAQPAPVSQPLPAAQKPAAAQPAPQSRPLPARPAAPAAAAGKEARPAKPAKSRRLWPIAVLILLVVCVAAVIGGYFAFGDKIIGLITKKTPTITVVAKVTGTPLPKPTEQPAALKPSATTAAPIATQTPAPTNTTAPVVLPSPTVPTPTETLPVASNVLFEDDFNAGLAPLWRAWGSPRPKIDSGFGDNWLYLAADKAYDAGVTSKPVITLSTGAEINFIAQLNPDFTIGYVLNFDWDPVRYERQPGDTLDGLFHLSIRVDKLTFRAPMGNFTCERPVSGVDPHTYRFVIRDGNVLDLFIDDGTEPACHVLDLGEAPGEGRLSFTGLGLVTQVKVTGK